MLFASEVGVALFFTLHIDPGVRVFAQYTIKQLPVTVPLYTKITWRQPEDFNAPHLSGTYYEE